MSIFEKCSIGADIGYVSWFGHGNYKLHRFEECTIGNQSNLYAVSRMDTSRFLSKVVASLFNNAMICIDFCLYIV